MTNILMNFRAFPVAMGRWFEWTLKDMGYNVLVAGPYFGDSIPWNNGPHHFPDHDFPPDIILPDYEHYPISEVLKIAKKSYNFIPDAIIQAGDTCYLSGPAPKKMHNIIIATDPHAVDYRPRLQYATHWMPMQNHYARMHGWEGDYTWLPYAYYPPVHFKIPNMPKKYDVVFAGLPYPERMEILNKASDSGYRVFNKIGVIYEEYRHVYNSGLIAFNHSSKFDVPARFWEGMAMGNLVLTNKIPELETIEDTFSIKDGVHYISYSSPGDALEKIKFYCNNVNVATKIAKAGYDAVQPHTYRNRVENLIWNTLT